MKQIVVNREDIFGPWMEEKLDARGAFKSGRAIGLVDEDGICACVWFEGWNGANIYMHVAAEPGKRWMTREFLWYVFHYPFVECGVKRITGLVAQSNLVARQFDEHIGFRLETRMKDAAPDGDMLVYVMFKDDCRWLKMRKGV